MIFNVKASIWGFVPSVRAEADRSWCQSTKKWSWVELYSVIRLSGSW